MKVMCPKLHGAYMAEPVGVWSLFSHLTKFFMNRRNRFPGGQLPGGVDLSCVWEDATQQRQREATVYGATWQGLKARLCVWWRSYHPGRRLLSKEVTEHLSGHYEPTDTRGGSGSKKIDDNRTAIIGYLIKQFWKCEESGKGSGREV